MATFLTPIGAQRYTLDEKNRVRMPARLLEELGDDLVLSPGVQKNLYIMSKDTFLKKHQKLVDIDLYDAELQHLYTALSGSCVPVERDAQNRIAIPESIKKSFKIDKEVVFVAKFDFVEMWPAEEYDNRPELMDAASIGRMLQKLSAALKDRSAE